MGFEKNMVLIKKWPLWLASLTLLGALAQAQEAQQIPPEVEAQAQAVEAKFTSVLNQECTDRLCTPVGCSVTSFRTLDEEQNSSLPGLDVSDENTGPLQYKLSSMRCEFAYEPLLSEQAVATLRKRISDKVRSTGMALAVTGRKLSATNPLLKEAQANTPAAPSSALETLIKDVSRSLPQILLILAITAALLSLIWAARRLGKEKPVSEEAVAAPETAPVSDASLTPAAEGPSAFEVLNKKERLAETLAANPAIAAAALEPIVRKGDVDEICRVLKHFGPEPLAPFAQGAEYRDLFASVHQRYGEEAFEESNTSLMGFLEKLERFVALAQLGRPETPLNAELGFLRDLAPDEFAQLVSGFQSEELMAILSFVPANLRGHFLQSRDPRFVEAYVQNVLQHPRLSEQMLRRLARQLHQQYTARFSEIRRVSRDQLTQIEGLLNTLAPGQRRQLYASIRKDNPALFERLSSEVLLDRALVNAPEAVLNDLFLTITPDEAAAYLQSHPDSKAILGKLKAPLSQSIRSRFDLRQNSDLTFLETSDPLAEQARLKVNDVLKAKSAKGEVNLRRINESVMDSL